MSEDLKEGMSNLKKGIIGVAGTMAAAIGTYVTTQFNSILGIEEEGGGAATEVVVESKSTTITIKQSECDYQHPRTKSSTYTNNHQRNCEGSSSCTTCGS